MRFLSNETPTIVEGIYVGYADGQKANKIRGENAPVSKAPSERELSSVCETEGECVRKKQI